MNGSRFRLLAGQCHRKSCNGVVAEYRAHSASSVPYARRVAPARQRPPTPVSSYGPHPPPGPVVAWLHLVRALGPSQDARFRVQPSHQTQFRWFLGLAQCFRGSACVAEWLKRCTPYSVLSQRSQPNGHSSCLCLPHPSVAENTWLRVQKCPCAPCKGYACMVRPSRLAAIGRGQNSLKVAVASWHILRCSARLE